MKSTITRRSARPRPLAEFIDHCIEPVLAAQGFAASDVILAWPEIVGERLARHTEPLQVIWPRRQARGGAKKSSRSVSFAEASGQPATLVIRVTSAFALELQHMAPIIVEKVNTHFGWRCIGQIALRQGPIKRRREIPKPEPVLDQAQEQVVKDALADIADSSLRQALEQLGKAILARSKS